MDKEKPFGVSWWCLPNGCASSAFPVIIRFDTYEEAEKFYNEKMRWPETMPCLILSKG